MNLITCAEDCRYQEDGYCQLAAGAPVSGVRVGGCAYFQKRGGPEDGPGSWEDAKNG